MSASYLQPAATDLYIKGIQHVLLDIEGTTCPFTFVADVLFPYARSELAGFLAVHGSEPQVQALLEAAIQHWRGDTDPEALALWRQACRDRGSGEPDNQGTDEDVPGDRTWNRNIHLIEYLQHLIDLDRKVTPLKDLQGLIWRRGYASGDLMAPLFDDVPEAVQRWHRAGVPISSFSSGSVAAQKLLYSHSEAGNLEPLFNQWFDTRVGSKQEAKSYTAIASTIGCRPNDIVFISDIRAELDAATDAGMRVLFSDRPGNPNRDPGPYGVIPNFHHLHLEP